jgi:hypothetical protein
MKKVILHLAFFLGLVLTAYSQAPIITHIEPSSAIPGSTVTLHGTNFETTPANNTITFTGVTATVITATTSLLVVTIPATTTGPGDVIIANTNGSSLAFSFTVLAAPSPGVFGNQNTINTSAKGAFSVYAADLDGDGDMDVLSATVNDNKIAWYKNDGVGGFTIQTAISTAPWGPRSVYAADLDGDGDMDVLSASYGDGRIYWYENDGTGGFTMTTSSTITTTADGARSVYAADLDGDGDMDVLSASEVDDKIAWYENDGVGGFTLPTSSTITTTADGAKSVYAADLDGDGDMDVLSASTIDNKIAWYKNDGAGGFTAQPAITTATNGGGSMYAADLDGDGDLDVLSSEIAWYQNDGVGNFTIQTTISNTPGNVYAADLDGDGDMDVLSYSGSKIAWYENDGIGGFSLPASSTITDAVLSAQSVYAADLDGDGDLDVLSASLMDDKIAWYPNHISNITRIEPTSAVADSTIKIYGKYINRNSVLVTFNGTPGTIDIVNSSASVLKVMVPDITPGLVDVVIASPGGQSVPQAPSNFTILSSTPPDTAIVQASISTTADYATSVYAADLDGDGDMDVLSSSQMDNKIAWYKNDGAGGFTAQPAISVTASMAQSVYAADLDRDGDMDVLSASYFDDKIAWYENDGFGGFSLPASSTITTTALGPRSVYAADLDGDGDLDVLSASMMGIAWYENDGIGGFTLPTSSTIIAPAKGNQSVFATDLDGDGDMDVLSASALDDKIAWYENTDGLGSFGGEQTISTTANGAASVYATDLDGDGDMDVLSASSNDSKIAWYENNGTGEFTLPVSSTITTAGASSVYAVDLDGDGDMDVLSTSEDGKVAWYENDGIGGFTLPTSSTITITADGANSVFAADLDGDGDMDVLSASFNDDKIAWYKRSFTGNDIVAFTMAGQTTNKVIDIINFTVAVEVANGTDLTTITPVASLSPGASVSISSTDYSSQVTYTVTSEIGVSQDWLVNVIPVTDAPQLNLTTTEQTTAGFSWNQPAYTQGFKLEVSTDTVFSGFITGYSPKSITNPATLSESLSSLTAGTQYYVRIRSYNQFNTESVNSTTLTILTIPANPSATAPASIATTSFQATWNAVTGADYYILEVS